MRLAVFGATGGTGREFTNRAIAEGHEIRALTRSPAKLSTGDAVVAVEGNVLVPEDVSATVRDADAVVCLLGRTGDNPRDVVSSGTENILAAMNERGVNRLVVLTSMGLGASVRQVPWYVRLANATVLHELMADKARQEELVAGSDVAWTVVRPGGLSKVLSGSFSAAGYLTGAVPASGSPFAGLFAAMGETPWFVGFVNVAVPWGELFIGLGLIVGALTRLAAFWGAFMMLMFYFGNWDIAHGYINGDFAYMLVFLAVAAFGAGRILGLDATLEQYEIDGRPLVDRYPWTRYLLG